MKLDEVIESEELTCAIPYAEIETLLRSIRESMKDSTERAIAFCADGQLSFPSEVGGDFSVLVPKCPGKKIGDFHTHPASIKLSGKSIHDWHSDISDHKRISCVGQCTWPVGKIMERTIVCHTFETEHPEYEDFRQRFLAASNESLDSEFRIVSIGHRRSLTDEEWNSYTELEDNIGELVEEGERKGIIKSCCKFSVPDVESMLEEQKPKKGLFEALRRYLRR